MGRWARSRAVEACAREVNGALNLYGHSESPISDVVNATSEERLAAAIEALRHHDCTCSRGTCQHAFPLWYVREAEPAIRDLERIVRQSMRAPETDAI